MSSSLSGGGYGPSPTGAGGRSYWGSTQGSTQRPLASTRTPSVGNSCSPRLFGLMAVAPICRPRSLARCRTCHSFPTPTRVSRA
jgi:hypothetical protein